MVAVVPADGDGTVGTGTGTGGRFTLVPPLGGIETVPPDGFTPVGTIGHAVGWKLMTGGKLGPGAGRVGAGRVGRNFVMKWRIFGAGPVGA